MNLHVNTCIVLNKKLLIRCKTISTGRKTVYFRRVNILPAELSMDSEEKSVDTSDLENSNSLTFYF